MIGAFVSTYIVCWIYQTGIRSQSKNTVKWTIFLTALFFGFQVGWNLFDSYFIYSETRPLFGPLIAGFIGVAFIRTKFIMREKLTLGNLFSHLNILNPKTNPDTKEF